MAASDFPSSVIVVGAGVFGLSTALAISRRHPTTKVVIVDRLEPPVADGASVDTTRCIRADYPDPVYAKLARQAQEAIKADPEFGPHYHENGMSFICNGQPGAMNDLWKRVLVTARSQQEAETNIVQMDTPEDVFQRIHGPQRELVADDRFSQPRQWNKGYCNLGAAFVDAEACIAVYAAKCRAQPSVSFQCGVPVKNLVSESDGRVTGVALEDGRELKAELIVLATGSWSHCLVNFGGRLGSYAHEVAWLKVTPEETERWKHMSITTNFDTGLNLFPPFKGEIKILRRSPGYHNTTVVPNPDVPAQRITISFPRTLVSNPNDVIPAEAESALRENLKEIMPDLADRPFDRTRLCWLAKTPSADFIITPHPVKSGLHLVIGGSAHGWKFQPILGDFAVDSIEGKLDPVLVEKWRWRSDEDLDVADGGNAPRVVGETQELRDVIRSRM